MIAAFRIRQERGNGLGRAPINTAGASVENPWQLEAQT
jgi:hypothetical protein